MDRSAGGPAVGRSSCTSISSSTDDDAGPIVTRRSCSTTTATRSTRGSSRAGATVSRAARHRARQDSRHCLPGDHRPHPCGRAGACGPMDAAPDRGRCRADGGARAAHRRVACALRARRRRLFRGAARLERHRSIHRHSHRLDRARRAGALAHTQQNRGALCPTERLAAYSGKSTDPRSRSRADATVIAPTAPRSSADWTRQRAVRAP